MLRPALLALPVSFLLLAGCPGPKEEAPTRECGLTIRYAPSASFAQPVQIKGEWNALTAEPMTQAQDGAWVFHLDATPRDYGYRLVVDGKELLDPQNPYSRWVANQEYSLARLTDCAQPQWRLDGFSASADGTVELSATWLDGDQRKGLVKDSIQVLLGGQAQAFTLDEATRRVRLRVEGLAQGKHNLRLRAQDREGRAAPELYLPFWVEQTPFDWQEAILYFVFTDRFRNGDPSNDAPVAGVDPRANYRGGDFAGVTAAIEEGYFDALGVRALWLSPVVANPDGAFGGDHGKLYTGYHGYWPSAPRDTQRRFGSLAELQALTRAAHLRGMRVITDLVINHVHEEHPYYRDHKDSGWFNTASSCVCGTGGCDWEARRLDCWFTRYLPDLNWRSTQLTDRMIEDALYWVKEADLDGFRLDAVKHLDQVAGKTLAGRLNEIGARTGVDYYLVGETFTGTEGRGLIAEYIGPHQLDGQFDFPLYWPLLDAFGKGGSLLQVDAAILENEAFYPPWILNSPFIGNHDVPRFISHAAGQVEEGSGAQAWNNIPPERVESEEAFRRQRDALTFVLTLPGVPLLYYGDEVGLPGTGDPDNRRMMRFGAELTAKEAALLQHVQKVGQARTQSRGLRFGARYTLRAEDDLLVYQRDDGTGPDGALVVIHRGPAPRTETVALQGRLRTEEGTVLRDVISGERTTVEGGVATLRLGAQSAAVYVLER
jgi:neopullulanase